MKDNKKYNFFKSLKNKYRLVLLNDNSLEEKGTITTSLSLALFVVLSIVLISIFSVFLLFSYTPLKEYVPGKTKSETHHELIDLSLRVDSLIVLIEGRDLYIETLKTILNGGTPIGNQESPAITSSEITETKNPSNADSLFRLKVEKKSSGDYILSSDVKSISFFPPVRGEITDFFSIEKQHFGIDIVTKKNSFISCIEDGLIVLSHWTKEAGFIIGVQHSNGFLSFYKHNSKLLKEVGEFVKKGDPIAVVGNSGELTSGPHLHLEIWENGKSVNPMDYIIF